MTKNHTFMFLILVLVLFLGISGCIDIHWAKSLIEEDKEVIDYHIVQKWREEHFFGLEFNTHEKDLPIHIIKGTIWMKINVSVILNQSIGIVRYLDITLFEPGDQSDRNMNLTRRYDTTTEEFFQIDDPIPGEWRFLISGRGIGAGGYQDSYVVEVTAYEPYRRS